MDIKENKPIKTIGTALVAGAMATSIHAATLSKETKMAIKNSMFGQDHYVRRTKQCINESILLSGKKINVKHVVGSAKSKYPVVEYVAQNALRKLAKTFCAVAGSVVLLNVGKSIVDKIKAEKEAEKTNMLI